MKKLAIVIFSILLIILLSNITGCKEIKTNSDSSKTDSLQSLKDIVNEVADPIWNDSPESMEPADTTKQVTTKVKKEDNWEYGIKTNIEDDTYIGSNQSTRVTNRMQGFSKSASIDTKIDLTSHSVSRETPRLSTTASSSVISKAAVSNHASRISEGSVQALGFSVGGAKDVNNFRENIENNYMPVVEDITHEGIFYDYFFDNNITEEATHLFEPAYTSYKNDNPLTGEEELYLSVGLNSNLTESSFQRKKLNLTIVLDISGSMSSSFDKYYYDRGTRKSYGKDYDPRSKMEIAKECIIDLTKHLKSGDRFAVVLFDHNSYLAKPFKLVEETDMNAIREHINEINPKGGTDMYAGINTATELYSKLPTYNSKDYENRIIFLTDAMPNTNVTNENTLWGVMKVNAENKIYTSFIGVGVDLNSELINYITKTPGANYYSVHNAKDFKKRMDTQFEYMVTPLVFDLTLHLNSENYDIDAVYGSPEADQATGEIMKVNTLFPSESSEGKTRGGIILIKLKKIHSGSNDIKLTCSYKDRDGVPYLNTENITFSRKMRGSDNGIRKAVLLSRYVNLMHDWINNKSLTVSREKDKEDDWAYDKPAPKATHRNRSRWERSSMKLEVNSDYKKEIAKFKNHFAKEATQIQDKDLRQELDILEKLVDYTPNKDERD